MSGYLGLFRANQAPYSRAHGPQQAYLRALTLALTLYIPIPNPNPNPNPDLQAVGTPVVQVSASNPNPSPNPNPNPDHDPKVGGAPAVQAMANTALVRERAQSIKLEEASTLWQGPR